jgi:hypothetical protein
MKPSHTFLAILYRFSEELFEFDPVGNLRPVDVNEVMVTSKQL